MDLNRLLFNQQLSLMARDGQMTDTSGRTAILSRYSDVISDFRDRAKFVDGHELQRQEQR